MPNILGGFVLLLAPPAPLDSCLFFVSVTFWPCPKKPPGLVTPCLHPGFIRWTAGDNVQFKNKKTTDRFVSVMVSDVLAILRM